MNDELHPEIPQGFYCYRSLGLVKDDDGIPRIKKEACPHWHKTENGARCDFLGQEHHTECPWHLIWDQVKECGVNEDRDWEPCSRSDEELIRDGFELREFMCICGKWVSAWCKGPTIK